MFTQPCFIRKNTPELRKKLEELGYIPLTMNLLLEKTPTLVAMEFPRGNPIFNAVIYIHEYVKMFQNEIKFIDCGTNENLFLAIASLRDDTDYGQWFIFDAESFLTLKRGDWMKFIGYDECVINSPMWSHKATVQELIEHFSKKEEKP
jgi:hypothetical protein